MTDTRLSRESDGFRGAVRELVEGVLEPLADRTDEEARFDIEALEETARTGLLGLVTFPIPKEHRGTGSDCLPYAIAVEEMGDARASTRLSYAAHTSLATMASGKTQKFQFREAAVERREFLETADTA
ncbi:MAG: acyl-CoA dehydrogenase family protein [Actinomycetota bacterium]|nr:acyl-CoA dehydrogenase family protein [Actinomycetota bacterium]